MKRAITTCICALMLGGAAVGQNYQIPNSDFEIWNDANEPGNGWYSFVSAKVASGWTAILIESGRKSALTNTTKVDGRVGAGIQIVSSSVAGLAKPNGNLTTGRIHMGSTKPADSANHNFTDRNGDANNCLFVGLPDSVSCWATFTRGESGDYHAQGNFILHGDIDYKDPHETDANVSAHRIAGGTLAITPCENWTYFSAPMTYTEVKSDKMYMLGSFTTNPTPGGSAGDKLQIDDVKFIYNSKLDSVAIGGVLLEGFQKDTYIYTIKGDLPAVEDIKAFADGRGATVDIKADANAVKIIVTGNDGAENQHVYSLVKEGIAYGITSIQLDGVDLEGFDPAVFVYKNLKMVNGAYPTVTAVSSDTDLTTVDVQLDEVKNRATIVVTDKANNKEYTYVLKFNNPQLRGDFELWEDCYPDGTNLVGQQPVGWTASNVFQFIVGKEFVFSDKGRTGSGAKIMNDYVGMMGIGANAPAFVTLGNMWVYADMMGLLMGNDLSNGGVSGGIDFAARPDSLTLYYKRKLGTENPDEPGKVMIYLWKGTFKSKIISDHPMDEEGGFGDPVYTEIDDQERAILGKDFIPADTKGDGVLIGSTEYTISSAVDEWTKLTIPIEYVEGENGKLIPEKMNIIFSGCNYWVRADIGKDNTLWVDDAELVYNAKLSSLKLNETDLVGFNSDKFEYTLPFNYRDKVIKAQAFGQDAAEVKIATAKETAEEVVKTITVTCDNTADVQKTYTYTLIFKGESAGEITVPEDMEVTYGDEFEIGFTSTNPDVPMTYTISNEKALKYDPETNKFYAIGAGAATVTARQEKEGTLTSVSKPVSVNIAKAKATMKLKAWCQRGRSINFTTTSSTDIANNGKEYGIEFEYEGLKNNDDEGSLKDVVDRLTDGKGIWVSGSNPGESEVVGEYRPITLSIPGSSDPITSLSTKNYEITLANLQAEIKKTYLTVYPFYSVGEVSHYLSRNDFQESYPVGSKIDWKISYAGFVYDEEDAVMTELGNDIVTVVCSIDPETAKAGEVVEVTVKIPETVLDNYIFRTYTGLTVKALKSYVIENTEIADKVYGDKPFYVPFVVKDSNGAPVDYSVSVSDYKLLSVSNDTLVTIKGAGEVYVQMNVRANEEHTAYRETVRFSVAKAQLMVKAKDAELAVGDKAPETFELVFSGFVNEDDSAKAFTVAPSAALEVEIPVDVKAGDTFPIIVNPGESKNYELTPVNGKLIMIVGTGINDQSLSHAFVYSANGAICVANNEAAEKVEVYTLQGVKIYEGTENVITTNIERNAMYIVCVGSYTTKVTVK